MAEEVLFVDVPPPEVVWVMGGRAASDEEPKAGIEAGEPVKAGQVVAGLQGTSAAGVAPLSGKVGRPQNVTDTRGRSRVAMPVLLDDDAEKALAATSEPVRIGSLSRDDLGEWIGLLTDAGLRDDRHNSPDLIAQLSAALQRPIDTLVCHTIEPDPLLPVQIEWAMLHIDAFRDGLHLLSRLVGASKTLVAVSGRNHRRLSRQLRESAVETATEDDDPEVSEAAEGALDGFDRADHVAEQIEEAAKGPQLLAVPHAYPQGDPSLLVWTLLKRKLSPGALPTEAGVVCIDAITAVALGRIAQGALLLRRQPLAIRDHGQELALLTQVWRGSRLNDVLEELGISAEVVRSGDYLRDQTIPMDAVIDGGAVLIHVESEPANLPPPDPCIRCGWCLEICPTGVHPAGLLDAEHANPAKQSRLAQRYGAAGCIGCGLCDYVCPSRIELRDLAVRLRDA